MAHHDPEVEKIMKEIPTDLSPSELEYGAKIGQGQYGTVYSGKCRGLPVAIKKLKVEALDPETLEDFRKEVSVLRAIRHPNLLLFLGACTAGGNLAIVTELLPGDDLQKILKNPKLNLSLQQRLTFAKEAAMGINWLHCMKPCIVHRDIKPANLLVDKQNHVRVCDFGFAAVKEKNKKIENPDGAPGSPIWMGPEVLQGLPTDEKSDVYAFGIVLWELLTRKPPFAHHNDIKTFMKAIVEKGERPPIPDGTLPSLKELMEACWAANPAKRPSMTEILKSLDNLLPEAVLPDPLALKLWRTNFLGEDTVEWAKFVPAFYKTIGVAAPAQSAILNPREDRKLLCLYILLADTIPDLTKEAKSVIVSLEAFGKFLHWFGPTSPNILEKLNDLCGKSWFHGKISKEETAALLNRKDKGMFIVRMSATEEGFFTISKVDTDHQVVHQRLQYTVRDQLFTILVENVKRTFPSLDKLISECKKDLKLKDAPKEPSKFTLLLTGDSGMYKD